ncbi:uncharacterized protein LOC143910241 [Arctopsyche grandis]|uniref:uncharacterized protein LOC143910241 n=1 Tax=Arctopsyche grandis TaxID=121162 RepID=UPI00406D68CA
MHLSVSNISSAPLPYPAVLKGAQKQKVPPPVPPRGSPKIKKSGGSSQHSPNKGEYSLHRQLQHKIAESELKRFQITNNFHNDSALQVNNTFHSLKIHSDATLNNVSLHNYGDFVFDALEHDSNDDDSLSSIHSPFEDDGLDFDGIVEECEYISRECISKPVFIKPLTELSCKEKDIKTQTNNMENFNDDPDIRANLHEPNDQPKKSFGMQKFMHKKHSTKENIYQVDVHNFETKSNKNVDPTTLVSSGHTHRKMLKSPDFASSKILKTLSDNINKFSRKSPVDYPVESTQGKATGADTFFFNLKKNKSKCLAPLAPGVKNPKMSPAKFEIKTYPEEHKSIENKSFVYASDAKSKINWFQKQVLHLETSPEQSVRKSLRMDHEKVSNLKKGFDMPTAKIKIMNDDCIEKYLIRDQKLLEIYSGYVSDKVKHFSSNTDLNLDDSKKSENQMQIAIPNAVIEKNKNVFGNVKIYIDIEDSI